MTDSHSSQTSVLVESILEDPQATREAKLIALMSERQLALFEQLVEIRLNAAETNRRVEHLGRDLQSLTERVSQLEDRFAGHEEKEQAYWSKIEWHYATCPNVVEGE